MEHRKLAFIGAGNMTRSLISGLIQAGYPAQAIWAANPSRGKLDSLAAEFGIHTTQDNVEAASQCEVVVLAVKPQMMTAMLAPLTQSLGGFGDKLLISIAAGVSLSRLQQMAGDHDKLVRTMPNTPSLLGLGMTGLYAGDHIDESDRHYCEQMMQCVGKTLWVAEEDGINQVIAAAGSAPAYFFLFMEAMAEHAQQQGFTAEQARLLVQQTALGAAHMVEANPQLSLAELRAQVTSKGGTTAAAIRSFQEQDLNGLVSQAMTAAVARARELEAQL